MIFDIENWLWMSNFGPFWHLPTAPILKIQSFLKGMLDFFNKKLSNFGSSDLKLHNRYCHTFAFFCQIVVHGIGTYKHFLTIIVFKGSLQCQYSHWLVSRRTKDFQIFCFGNNGNLKMNYFWYWMCLKKYLCFGQCLSCRTHWHHLTVANGN